MNPFFLGASPESLNRNPNPVVSSLQALVMRQAVVSCGEHSASLQQILNPTHATTGVFLEVFGWEHWQYQKGSVLKDVVCTDQTWGPDQLENYSNYSCHLFIMYQRSANQAFNCYLNLNPINLVLFIFLILWVDKLRVKETYLRLLTSPKHCQ